MGSIGDRKWNSATRKAVMGVPRKNPCSQTLLLPGKFTKIKTTKATLHEDTDLIMDFYVYTYSEINPFLFCIYMQ